MPGGSATPVVAAVAFIGRTNETLFYKTFVGSHDDGLRLNLAVFASLDAVDEKLQLRKTGRLADSSKDAFLGMLMPVEENKVFGYITNTQVKILLVVRDVLLREDRLRELFKMLHRMYADALCNPFAAVDAPVTSPAFDEAVTRAIESANTTLPYTGPLPL